MVVDVGLATKETALHASVSLVCSVLKMISSSYCAVSRVCLRLLF